MSISPTKRRARILLVDDSVSVAALIVDALHEIELDIEVAYNGIGAVKSAVERDFDLMLLDYKLPDMNGKEIVEALRARNVHIPFVTITGHGGERIAVEMMKAGAQDYLIKDESFLSLLPTVVSQALKNIETRRLLHAAERELLQKEHRFLELFNNMTSGVAVYEAVDGGHDFVFVDFNRTAERLTGVSREDLLGKRLRETFSTALESGLLDTIQRVWKTGGTEYHPPFRTIERGTEVWRENVVYRLSSGEVVAIFDDVTERENGAKALRESENKYKKLSTEFRTILEGITDSLSLLTPDMKIVWSNDPVDTQSKEDLPSCYEVFCERSKLCNECPVQECFRTGRNVERLVPHGKKVFGVKAFPIKGEDGTVLNVIRMGVDITEKLLLRKEAERSGRLASLGELSAGVAHEINNPNALILLNSPVLMDVFNGVMEILDRYQEENGDFYLGNLKYSRMRNEIPRLQKEIYEGAQRIKRIVDDLKDFVGRDSGDQMSDVDLNEVVRAASRLAGNIIKNATDRFEVDCADDLPPIKGVSQRIEQVVVNLLINACQALSTKEKGLFVSTSYERESDSVVVEVRDEGTGILPEHLPHVTDPFFTTRRETGGTGLGLSVSARIVKEHRGHLVFDSKNGSGTTVSLILPVGESIAS